MTLDLATRQSLRLRADPGRVVGQLFMPGHALPGGHEGHPSAVVEHLLSLSDDDVDDALASVLARFEDRHRDLPAMLRHHADRIRNRLAPGVHLSERRWLLLGAMFTQEVAIAGAALCNPSAVPMPDQSAAPAGALRFVMSVREIGEGHRSSIGFRTGTVDAHGTVTVDVPDRFVEAAAVEPGPIDGHTLLDGSEAAAWALGRLGARFTVDELESELLALEHQRDSRRDVVATVGHLRDLAARTYTARCAPATTLGERVLFPAMTAEANGMEDARFVRFVGDDGAATYYATYTAYDGRAISQQLLATDDFMTFRSSPLLGAAAMNKGLALFPRRIGGDLVALSRFDGSTNAIARTRDIHRWPTAEPLQARPSSWEAVQVGNCGSPIETDAGWLVLTHGVGPMRTYSMGAMLLDLDDPIRVIGVLDEPLLAPVAAEQDGYVPNVVYSCGALVHGDHLVIPFGIGDASIGFATVSMTALLAVLTGA